MAEDATLILSVTKMANGMGRSNLLKEQKKRRRLQEGIVASIIAYEE
jgi:hypothetical protein